MFRLTGFAILAAGLASLCLWPAAQVPAADPGTQLRAPDPAAPAQWDGLVLKPSSRVDAVYVQPNADVKAYKTVQLDPVEISFAKEWDPNRGAARGARKVSAKDVQAIRDRMSELFQQVFRDELASGGYTLVDEPDHDTLRVTPAIVDLYINAAVTPSMANVKTYSTDAGRMTLVLELRDAVTGAIVARAIDARSGRDRQQMITVSNELKNRAEATKIFETWAGALRAGLDEIRAGAD